jgi:pyrimidine-nucleoside phosphorylase
MDMQSFIATRRDAGRHSEDELRNLADGAANGSIPDYQLAAWLMAAYLNPLDDEETAYLTLAMADSGTRLDLTGLPKPWVDKHSTGGVGDKTTIVLLPLLASCGLTIIKMSGRGLGVSGGTVDKLGSIPGFRLDLSPDELKAQAGRIGLALTGQTPDLAPADKILYALRDVTATVGSIPLIVSSILSKKLAGGAETVVLDVKCGKGAFMHSFRQASDLAEALQKTAIRCGLNVRIAISDMDQPLGSAVGNCLEVLEAIRVLKGEKSRFAEHCFDLAGLTLAASGLAETAEVGVLSARAAIESGAAAKKAQEWFSAQGAQIDVVEYPEALRLSPISRTLKWDGPSGWVSGIDAYTVGHAVVLLGGGRQKKDDEIDTGVGVELNLEVGSKIEAGDKILTIYAKDEASAEVAETVIRPAISVSDSEVRRWNPILRTL